MNYESKYNELVEAIRTVVEGNPGLCNIDEGLGRLRELLPEKESEDERIRKFLVKHVFEWIGYIEHDLKISSKDVESEEELAMFKAGLAWLEKQKEQKPAEWSEEK